MTDDELKLLVANLAVAQNHTDEQMKRNAEAQKTTDEQMKRNAEAQKTTDEQMKRNAEAQKTTDEQMKRNAQAQKVTGEQIKATDQQIKATDEQMKRTDEQMKRTDEKLKRIGITLGNIGQNQGAVAEEFFYNSLKGNQTLAGVHYDFIDKNVSRTSNGVSDEYDMILVNGQDVAIIEVKYKAHEEDLIKLLTKKYNNFKKLFPAYKDYRHHLVLATFYLYNELKEQALQNNVIVLQRKGDIVESYLPANDVLI